MAIHWTKSTWPYCGVGCGLMVGVDAGKGVKVRGMKGRPINDGRICALAVHFNTRTRSGRVPRLNAVDPDNFIEINRTDSDRLGIAQGKEIEVTSRRAGVRGSARITDRGPAGTIYMNMHYGGALWVGENKPANLVGNTAYDNLSKPPEFKYVAVKVSNIGPE